MPRKYHINIKTLPPRHEPIPPFCAVETQCLHCTHCVKDYACVYSVNKQRGFDAEQVLESSDNECMSCLRCVQECKGAVLGRVRDSRFDAMGDDYWTPEIIQKIWGQAETGKIPVSGAGYRGPFAGPGFDQIWTDMSEIVRPTRDGIHGREYIGTVIELGRKPDRLEFDQQGGLLTKMPAFLELPIPIILDISPLPLVSEPARQAIVRAAANLGTLAVATREEASGPLSQHTKSLIVRVDPSRDDIAAVKSPVVELADSPQVLDFMARVKQAQPGQIVAIRMPLDENAAARACDLTRQGAEVIHLQASPRGRGLGKRDGDFITVLMREVNMGLVKEGLREQVTLLISGGIAMAEHIAKIIICGADGVGLDLALMVALECRLCSGCGEAACPVVIEKVPVDYGTQRIVNLVAAMHDQLIEVMGAMGLREVCRLRGEVGRAMFMEDLERENFKPIFADRAPAELSSGNAGWDAAQRGVARETPVPVPGPWDFPAARELLQVSPTRYRNRLSKYRIVKGNRCIGCGKCYEICTQQVYTKAEGVAVKPKAWLCAGPQECRARGACCVDMCPVDNIAVIVDPVWRTFGDPRWTSDLIVSTWLQAETGRPPVNGLEHRVGASGGGFDRMDFVFPAKPSAQDIKPEDIDLSIALNRRGDNRPQVRISVPFYGGGMSFGSISLSTMTGRAQAYKAFNSFTCTGEGGYPDALAPYQDNVITQVATGLFGVSEETIQRARIVEFKYAQGAKPGLGGHLLGDKVTPAVAKIREAVVGTSLFSPFPFHSVYSVEDHKKHVDWIKEVNPRALISVKVSSPSDVDMVAVGSYYAGAHIIHIDGKYGGTGAAPDISKKNIAMPIEYAIPKVHQFLVNEGIRDQITLMVSGGLRSAWDIAKAIALGADGAVLGTSEIVALECIRCGRCESGRGCPRGIATTDPELSTAFSVEWARQRLVNLFHSYAIQLQDILWRLGMESITELVGRSDLLVHLDYVRQAALQPQAAGKR